MKKLALTLAAVASTAAAVPALAGGLNEPVVEPVIAPAPAPMATDGDWTGGYGGVALSYGDVSVGATDGNGALAGIRAGYDWDFGKFVVGGGLDYDWSNVELDNGVDTIDNVARLRLRAGADMGPALLYATAGLARAEATVGGASLSDNGYFGGIGADYKIRDNLTIGGEILMHRFDNFANSGADVDATTAGINVGLRF